MLVRFRRFIFYGRVNTICFFLLISLIGIDIRVFAQNSLVLKAAELKIAGKTNVADFSCNLRKAFLNDTLTHLKGLQSGTEVFDGLQLVFKVSEFTCDLPLMTKDFQNLLQSKEHPNIILTIADIYYKEAVGDHQSGSVDTWVNLRIADKSRLEQIDRASIHTIRNKTILSGTHGILMTTFDIQPPIKFFGTVRTEDRLEIQFNIQLE